MTETVKSLLSGKDVARMRPGATMKDEADGHQLVHRILTGQLQEMQARCDELEAREEQLETDLAAATSRADTAERDIQEAQTALDAALQANKDLEEAADAQRARADSFQEQLLEQTQGRYAAEGELRGLRARVEKADGNIAAERQARAAAEERFTTALATLKPSGPVEPPTYEMKIIRDAAGELRSVTLVPTKGT